MPRMRTLKPSFFSNDQLAEVHPLGRLLFEGLWCMADREGRLEDRPKRIKAEVLPYDNCNIDRLLDDLEHRGFILRYEVDANRYIQVLAFGKHQNPHVKEPPSTIPAPCEHGAGPVLPPNGHHTSPASHAGVLSHGLQEQEQEQIQEQEPESDAASAGEPVFSTDERQTIDAVGRALADFGFSLVPRMWRKVLAAYATIDLEAEAYKQADWLRRNRVKSCSAARYTNWLDKARPKVTPIRGGRDKASEYERMQAEFGYLGSTA
jgi:hypothetical protein